VKPLKPPLRSAIRFAEILIIAILAANALFTYRELQMLRKVPVALPSYQFESIGDAEKPAVETRGTWIAVAGPTAPLQTTTIECRKTSMQCQESSAVLSFVGDSAVMESSQTTFEIDHWDEKEIVTKAVRGPCVDRTLVLSLVEKRASTRMSPSRTDSKCAESPERVLELVAGYKVRSDALRKASPF
jgi:hypothetical protein